MSVDYKAKILIGYKLKPNWNEVVSEDFYDTYCDYFHSIEYDSQPSYFAAEAMSIDEGTCKEFSFEINDFAQELINSFPSAYKSIIEDSKPRVYLAHVVY